MSTNKKIKFIQHCKEMPLAYSLSDVVVSASIEPEAFGRISVEAQSMGKPIIASNIGGSKETVINKNELGIVDNQDAIIGNPLYDVSSLIDDVRIKLPNKLQNQLLDFYHKNSKLESDHIEKLKNDFDILSVQRNLKILGIFVRLYKRDNKDNYLKFLPYTWTLIEKRLQNPVLKNLKLLFYKHLYVKKLKKLNKI